MNKNLYKCLFINKNINLEKKKSVRLFAGFASSIFICTFFNWLNIIFFSNVFTVCTYVWNI